MPFGLISVSEGFQQQGEVVFQGVDGIYNVAEGFWPTSKLQVQIQVYFHVCRVDYNIQYLNNDCIIYTISP